MTPKFSEQVESLIRVASRLIAVLDREVEMLRRMNVAEVATLREEKQDLTLAYEQAVRAIAAAPQQLDAIEPALKAELAEVAQRFDGALAANARALHAVRESHDRMLKAVVDAVAEERARQKAYNDKGAFDTRRHSRRAPTLSLSFDRTL